MRDVYVLVYGFEMLVTSSVLILGIFALRKLTLGKISMGLRYGLWLLVAVRLLMPMSLGTSPVSVMNLFSDLSRESAAGQEAVRMTNGAGGVRNDAMQVQDAAQGQSHGAGESEMASGVNETNGADTVLLQNPAQGSVDTAQNAAPSGGAFRRISRRFAIMAVWAAGVLSVTGYMLFMRFRFLRYLRKTRKRVRGEEIPVVIRGKLIDRGIKVYRVKGLPSPCLAGRCIYIGEEIPGGEQGLTHVLTHEYCHALHGDSFWAFLRCALTAVYWFDPFVWAAAFEARQDSDLACDEAVVRLLGEEERFAYGRTLLALLQAGGGRVECPGMPPMFSGSERSVRERIVSLTEKNKAEAVVLAAVLSLTVLLCGCAFTGAQADEVISDQGESGQQDGENPQEAAVSGEQNGDGSPESDRQWELEEESNSEFAQIQAEYEDAVKAAEDAAFQEVLNYRGVMEGRDDSELSLDRQVDIQLFVDYLTGRQEEAPETGWYLLCRSENEKISVYGLYTEEFGCRGMKLLIGEDVNTFDLVWHPSYMNAVSENIRVMEEAADGLPRRFVWKYMEEESGDIEIWQLAGGYRYDTGTVDITLLSEETYLSWADWHLSYSIDQEKPEIRVYYDGSENALAGILDISDYADFTVEAVQIEPETVSFELNSDIFGEESIIIHLTPGLKLEGMEGLWHDDIHPIAVQVLWNEDGTGFQLGQPKVDERYVVRGPLGRNLETLREIDLNVQDNEGKAADESVNPDGENRLAEPLVNNSGDGHHDLEITFRNPCPDYERISDGYGERTNPSTGEIRAHNGVDLAAPEGADVLAAAEGTVFETGFDAENGNYVVLYHGQSGQMTYYSHCKDVLVSKGDEVAAGGKIATVGKTGRATGPHLHFALSYEGKWQEPVWGQRTHETE